jgi:hypothetical protein
LDRCERETILEVRVPRVRCLVHGEEQMSLGFAEDHSQHAVFFEMRVLGSLELMLVRQAAKRYGVGGDAIGNIKQGAVKRGLARRGPLVVKNMGSDETSSRKG